MTIPAVVLAACGSGSEMLRWDDSNVAIEDVKAEALELGLTAACNDGAFDQTDELSSTCGDQDGVFGWLYRFAECADGSYVVLNDNDNPSCKNHDGFLRAVDDPSPAKDSVARCNDGLFDNESDLERNCREQGGIASFLAIYAECANDRVILMTRDGIGCDDRIARLLPDGYEPQPGSDDVALCNDGLFDNESDLERNCRKQGGIDGFLAAYAECENGDVVEMIAGEPGCANGIARLLPDGYEPSPTTTAPATTSPPPTRATTSPPTAPPEPSACVPVSDADLADTIGLGLTVEGGGVLADGNAVVPGPDSQLSTGWPDLYIAATIRGAGLGDNTVGAWAVGYNEDAMFITGPIYPANILAREFSDWGSGAASGSEADDLMKFLRQTDASKLAESCID